MNGRRAPKGMKLSGGETISVKGLPEDTDNLVRPDAAGVLKTVYEDPCILAFDKPAGMPVQPLSYKETGTLMNSVAAAYPECRTISETDAEGNIRNTLMAGALHRIDADTSGLVVVARSQSAFDFIRDQFSAQTVTKTYLALVEGAFHTGGTVEGDLVHDPTVPFCRMVDSRNNRLHPSLLLKTRPLHAVTVYKPVAHTKKENEELTLLEVTIHTGVTHQIRAQLALAGMHIVNDRLYGAFAVEGMTGHCLHSFSAEFIHPSSGGKIRICTPLPEWAELPGYGPVAATTSMPRA